MNYFNKTIFWLYSSTFSNTWWGYNEECSNKLNLIYNDYIKRTNPSTCVNTYDTQTIGTIISNHVGILPSSSQSIASTFDTINYTDDDDDNNDNINEIHNDKNIDYTISFNNTMFCIDIDHMQQINYHDKTKKRKIMRVVVPNDIINIKDQKNYLINKYKFRGIAGATL